MFGKSTSATTIALGVSGILRQITAPNPRVLLIDTDSQGHATLVTTGHNDYGSDDSLYSVLMADRQTAPQMLSNVIVSSQWNDALHVLPASPLLEGAERELMGVAGAPYRIADPLAKIASHYAAIVIDTRPSFSLMTEMALVAATDAIVPVEPRYLETVGLLSISGKIHDGRLTPTQALRELVQSAQLAARQRGQPFDGLLDLLPNPDSDRDEASQPSPVETLLRDLVNLAVTIRDDGQVNPLTVVDVSEGVTQQFRIETGEQRYRATWLLRDFIPHYQGDGMIPCIIVPADLASPFRQAKENTARTGLSAIAMARQAALLILTVHGCELPGYAVNNDFYRQALDLDLRGKSEYTTEILSATGDIGKERLSQYKALLRLSDEAMELADRNDVDERKLRYVLRLSQEYHTEVIRQIIDFNLTSKQVRELCQDEVQTDEGSNEGSRIPRSVKQFAKISRSSSQASAEDVVHALMKQKGDPLLCVLVLKQ